MAEETEPPVIIHGDAKGFAQKIQVGSHHLIADEPLSFGGTDSGASPYDLILAALGSCTSMTIGLYARKRGWPLEEITVSLRHSKIHARDCDDCETKEGKVDRMEREIELTGELDEGQRERLLEIANKCPVHRTLSGKVSIQTRLL